MRVLVEHGHAGASTLQIQREAGVSRGRLLHQFASREALLVAAVSHLASIYMTSSGQLSASLPDSSQDRVNAAVTDMWANYQQDHFWAATELWLAARHHPALAEALRPVEHVVGERVRAATDSYFGPTLCDHPDYRATRELLNTSMRGVALTYAFNGRRDRMADDTHLPQWRDLASRSLLDP
ncbi:TetR family transcriptional regulator [Solicola sp. PLA-1-18]|uniref:TetR family transcriptional regulator n=1 Tax=Solicola sp. PLA-1-18 TaxID=3380532 RepID=UPI003B8202C7